MRTYFRTIPAIIALTTPAAAQVVSYDNSDGTFVWAPWLSTPGGTLEIEERTLDITLTPAENQANLANPQRAISTDYNYPLTSLEVLLNYTRDVFPNGLTEVAAGSLIDTGSTTGFQAKAFSPPETVGPSETYMFRAATATHPIGGPEPILGDRATIGIRFPTDATLTSFHYGYVVLEWRDGIVFPNITGGTSTLKMYQPVAWAYEATPDTPIAIPSDICLPDTNGDGSLTPADFSAWIAAFNAQAPACDQNGDTVCTPADFSAWIANYNAGC